MIVLKQVTKSFRVGQVRRRRRKAWVWFHLNLADISGLR